MTHKNGLKQWFSTTGTWGPFHRDLEHYRNQNCIRKCLKIKYFSKKHKKSLLPGQLTPKQICTGTKDFKNILLGLEPKKVENHWSNELKTDDDFMIQMHGYQLSYICKA